MQSVEKNIKKMKKEKRKKILEEQIEDINFIGT